MKGNPSDNGAPWRGSYGLNEIERKTKNGRRERKKNKKRDKRQTKRKQNERKKKRKKERKKENKSSKDRTWSAVTDALLGVIS